MDPLSVLGLVSNVVQLLDAAAKAFSICREIYTSGSSLEDSQILLTSRQLHQNYSVLRDSLKANANVGPHTFNNDSNLLDLASKCCETASDLQALLDPLCGSHQGGFRKATAKIGLKIRRSKKIQKFKARLDEYQKAVDSMILADISQDLGKLGTRHEGQHLELTSQLSQLSADLANCQIPVSNSLKVEIDRLIKASEAQHLVTRQYTDAQITTAVQQLEISQNLQRDKREQEQYLEQRVDQLIGSLTYDESNVRTNEVSSTHSGTFQWIFDDRFDRPWDSFSTWLREENGIYWIQGKAGTGKSTLMKFIANDNRTRSLLAKGSTKNEYLIVTFYFWLSGTKSQRSMKGFLCSIVRQILLGSEHLSREYVNAHESPKRFVGDWSEDELRRLLRDVVSLSIVPICVFVDGLDEFDHDADIDDLLTLIEEVSEAKKAKFCVSSRPENYIVGQLSKSKKLQLQDLTAGDIETYVRDQLNYARAKCAPTSIDGASLDELVADIRAKAGGVFLWVRYALRSLIQGIRNGDDFQVLVNRLRILPNGMHELYLQMWKRSNEDEQLYRDEAALYFSYACEARAPNTLFELLVAVDESVQDRYFRDIAPQDLFDLSGRCDQLRARISIRCAGLLEVHARSISRSTIRAKAPNLNDPFMARYNMTINFFHRTAEDFLKDTKDGQNLLGNLSSSYGTRYDNITRAMMARIIQGIIEFNESPLRTLIGRIAGTDDETSLLINLRRIAERLSIPKLAKQHVGCRQFWVNNKITANTLGHDFESTAASHGCCQYIRRYVQYKASRVSPYYLGYLFCSAARFKRSSAVLETKSSISEKIALMSWLGRHGADMYTPHIFHERLFAEVHIPVRSFLYQFMRPNVLGEVELGKLAFETLHQFLPSIVKSGGYCTIQLLGKQDWMLKSCIASLFEPSEPNRMFDGSVCIEDSSSLNLWISMSIVKLCYLVMAYFEEHGTFQARWSRPTLREADMSKVVCCRKGAGPKIYPHNEDSVRLGKLLDRILLKDSTVAPSRNDLVEELYLELASVSKHAPQEVDREWRIANAWEVDHKDISPHTLDPAEVVDNTNWREKGHFRGHNDERDIYPIPDHWRVFDQV